MDPQLLSDQREGAKMVSDILLELAELTVPGVQLDMLAEIAERRIREAGAEPAFKNYKPSWAATPFPCAVCVSVNNEVCHGRPRGRVLEEGDIVSYDLGLKYKSGYADSAITVPVGEIDNRKQRALRYCLEALYEGIKAIKPGVPVIEIGKAVEANCIKHGYRVIKEMGGHYIGKEMHEKPDVPNYDCKEFDPKILLKEGDVLCVEPMITPGDGIISLWKEDGWTVYAKDFQPVVHFEHQVLVTKEGYEILTTWDK